MLKILRGGQRWLTGLFVVAIGGVFVFFLGLGGPLSGRSQGTVVQVGPNEFGVREFEQVRSRRERLLQQELGASYDPSKMREVLDNLAARELVDQTLLAMEAEHLGLTVSTREIEQFILADPSFRNESGRFDKEAFERYASYEYGSQHAFLAARRRSLLAFKLLRLLQAQPQVSDGEAREAVESQLEQVRIAWVALDATERSEDLVIEPAAIEAALETRGEELQALYDELADRYNAPEQVRARHVLLKVPRDADSAEVARVEALAKGALERLQEGADFAEVAAEISEDPGSASQGGDLGFFGRGQMVPEFEEAAFALAPGEMSGLVRTDYGFHVIRTEERKEAVSRSFEEVRAELAEELLRREAESAKAREATEALAKAIRDGRSLEAAAREAELTIERSGFLPRRADGFVPGLGAAQELLATAFAMEPGESSPRVFEVGDKLVLVQTLEKSAPSADDVEPRLEATREQLLVAKRNTRADGWVARRRQELLDAGQLVVDLEGVR